MECAVVYGQRRRDLLERLHLPRGGDKIVVRYYHYDVRYYCDDDDDDDDDDEEEDEEEEGGGGGGGGGGEEGEEEEEEEEEGEHVECGMNGRPCRDHLERPSRRSRGRLASGVAVHVDHAMRCEHTTTKFARHGR